jgi:hypothetical protein
MSVALAAKSPKAPGINPDLPFYPLSIAVLTISDTRTEQTDTSGGLLADRGVALADRVVAGGEEVVSEQLGYEVALYVFGASAERRRRVVGDTEEQQAVALLRGTTSPQALLGLGPSEADRPH